MFVFETTVSTTSDINVSVPPTVAVFDNVVAPRTASVPSVSIPDELITVLTVLLPVVNVEVVRLTLAPTLIPVLTLADPVILTFAPNVD